MEEPAAAFTAMSPTMGEINTAYGPDTASCWIMAELTNLSEFCGCKNKLTTEQIEETADIIAIEYKYFKMTELLLFFGWMKLGKYGEFYGSLDPIRITAALKEFTRDRAVYITRSEEPQHNPAYTKEAYQHDVDIWIADQKEIDKKKKIKTK